MLLDEIKKLDLSGESVSPMKEETEVIEMVLEIRMSDSQKMDSWISILLQTKGLVERLSIFDSRVTTTYSAPYDSKVVASIHFCMESNKLNTLKDGISAILYDRLKLESILISKKYAAKSTPEIFLYSVNLIDDIH